MKKISRELGANCRQLLFTLNFREWIRKLCLVLKVAIRKKFLSKWRGKRGFGKIPFLGAEPPILVWIYILFPPIKITWADNERGLKSHRSFDFDYFGGAGSLRIICNISLDFRNN